MPAAATLSGRTRPQPRARPHRLALAVCLVLAAVLVTGDSPPAAGSRVGVPAYFYPYPGDRGWDALAEAPPASIVVVTTTNGPGAAVDPNYSAVVERLLKRRLSVYGYVDTAYATRAVDVIVAEAEVWRRWYGVRAIFLDQTAPGADSVSYYEEMVGRLHAAGFAVAMNPGQVEIDERYVELADQVVVFEGPLEQYRSTVLPEWMQRADSGRLWHLVYGVAGESELREVVRLAEERNAGVLFVTDGVMPNPWDRIPPYWTRELELLEGRQPD